MTAKGTIIAAIVALGLLGAACSDDGSSSGSASTSEAAPPTIPDRGNVDGALRIGYLLPTSGQSASVGPPMIKGIEMAVRDVNAAGGVNGEQVAIVGGDEGDDPSIAGVTVDRLLNTEKVDVMVGPASSTTALQVLGRITEAGVLACSPSNTALALEQFPDDGYYVRTAPSDRLQGVALAEVIAEGGYRTVALMSPNDDYGRGFADVLIDQLRANGIQVTISFAYDPNGTNFAPDVRRVLETDPEAIAVIGLPDTGGLVLRKLIDLGAGPDRLPTFVPDGLRVPSLYQRVDASRPESTAGIRGTAVASVPDAELGWVRGRVRGVRGRVTSHIRLLRLRLRGHPGPRRASDPIGRLGADPRRDRQRDPWRRRVPVIRRLQAPSRSRTQHRLRGGLWPARPHRHRRSESGHLRRVRLQPRRHQHHRAPDPGQPLTLLSSSD